MNRPSLLPWLGILVACSASLALGYRLGLHLRADERPVDVAAPDPGSIRLGSAPADGLPEARKRIAQLEAQLAAAERALEDRRNPAHAADPAGEGALAPLRARLQPLLDANDGWGLIRLMGRFTSLGKAGYPDAIAIWEILKAAERAGEPDLGLGGSDLGASIGQWMPDFARWALLNPEGVPAELRLDAAGSLHYARWAEPQEIAAMLARESDGFIAGLLANGMSNTGLTDDLLPGLEAAARAHAGHPDGLSMIVGEFGAFPGTAAQERLRVLASDSDPALSSEARLVLTWLEQPVNGLLVRSNRDSDPGTEIRKGDIVVAVRDKPLGSLEEWRDLASQAGDEDASVPITYIRDGRTVTTRVPAKSLEGIGAMGYMRGR